jgi:hypothetical protein
MRDREWTRTLAEGRKLKVIYEGRAVAGAFLTAQLAGSEVAYSVVLPKTGKPSSRDEVESQVQSKNSPRYSIRTVRNGTEYTPSRCHHECMQHKKDKEPIDATQATVKKEMAGPRMARSARIAERNLDTARVPEQPSTTMSGTVDRIIPSPRPSQSEKAQIAVDRPDHRHRVLRIENSLTDEHGDEVKLKKGAHVEVTVTAEPKTVNRRNS